MDILTMLKIPFKDLINSWRVLSKTNNYLQKWQAIKKTRLCMRPRLLDIKAITETKSDFWDQLLTQEKIVPYPLIL